MSAKKSNSTTPTTGSLLAQLKAETPDSGRGNKTWHERLRKEQPSLMAEVDSLVDQWLTDPELRSIKQTKNSLARWIKDRLDLPEGRQAIVAYIDGREHVAG